MKNYFKLFLVIALFTSPFLSAQNPFLDSLKVVVDTMPDSGEKVENLIIISTRLYSGDLSKQYGFEALEVAKRTGNALDLAKSYDNLAGCYYIVFQVDSFNLYADKAEDLYETLEDYNGLASIYSMKATILGNYNQLEESAQAFEKAYEYAQKAGDNTFLVGLFINWSGLYRETGKAEIAEEKLKKALAIYEAEGMKNEATKARVLFNLGYAQFMNQNYEESLENMEAAYGIRVAQNNLYESIQSLLTFVLCRTKMLEKQTDTPIYDQTIKRMGFENTQSLIDSVETTLESINDLPLWEWFYDITTVYQVEANDFESAYHSLRQSVHLKDSLTFQSENIEGLADLRVKYENEVLQNEVLTAQIAETKSTNQRNISLLVLAAALLLASVGYLYFQQRLNARNIALELQEQRVLDLQKQQQLIAMNAMLEGQEKERGRIAKDLHDGLGNMLSTIKYQIAGLSLDLGNRFEGIQGKAENMIDEACSEVRKIAHNMMPFALKQLGLEKALEDLCEKNKAQHGYSIDFQSFGTSKRLAENVEMMLYRVSQEIFQNINKYAKAKEVLLQMTYDDEWLNLTFEDDGIGFDLKAVKEKGGLGLHSIQSRVEYLSGECMIDSRPNEGTSISINIPLNQENLKEA